jgi:hypothetical protein
MIGQTSSLLGKKLEKKLGRPKKKKSKKLFKN